MPLPIIPRRGWNSCNALPNNHQVNKVHRSVPHYKSKKSEKGCSSLQLSSSKEGSSCELEQHSSQSSLQLSAQQASTSKRDSNHNLWHRRLQKVHKMDAAQLQKLYLKNAIVTTTGHHHHHHRSSIINATAASPTVIKVAHRGPWTAKTAEEKKVLPRKKGNER